MYSLTPSLYSNFTNSTEDYHSFEYTLIKGAVRILNYTIGFAHQGDQLDSKERAKEHGGWNYLTVERDELLVDLSSPANHRGVRSAMCAIGRLISTTAFLRPWPSNGTTQKFGGHLHYFLVSHCRHSIYNI